MLKRQITKMIIVLALSFVMVIFAANNSEKADILTLDKVDVTGGGFDERNPF